MNNKWYEKGSPGNRFKRLRYTGAGLVGLLIASSAIGATAAHAAYGDPFYDAPAGIYLTQSPESGSSADFELVHLLPANDGGWTETRIPLDTDGRAINAIGYNESDGYIYARLGSSAGTALYRMGQGGSFEHVVDYPAGSDSVTGTVNPDGIYFMYDPGKNKVASLDLNNVEAGWTFIDYPSSDPIYDFTWHEDYLFAVNDTGEIVSFNPGTGDYQVSSASLPAARYGAASTLPNGNLAFTNNWTGDTFIVQAVSKSGIWEFETLSVAPGKPTSQNDSTYVSGKRPSDTAAVDLRLTKTGPERFMVGSTIEYKFTVENVSDVDSTGIFVNDLLPKGLINPRLSDGSTGGIVTAEEDGRTRVYYTNAGLKAGDKLEFTLIVDSADTIDSFEDTDGDPSNGLCFTNEADVFAIEAEAEPMDNSAATGCSIPYDSSLFVDKEIADIVDVNGNGIIDEGDTISWTFTATNDGRSDLTDVRIEDDFLNDRGVTITGGSASLAAGESTIFTSDEYTITAEDAESGSVKNVAIAKGKSPNGLPEEVESPEDTTNTPVDKPGEPTDNLNASASAGASANADADINS